MPLRSHDAEQPLKSMVLAGYWFGPVGVNLTVTLLNRDALATTSSAQSKDSEGGLWEPGFDSVCRINHGFAF